MLIPERKLRFVVGKKIFKSYEKAEQYCKEQMKLGRILCIRETAK